MTVRGALLILCCALACGAPERQQWVNTYDGDGEDLFVLDDDLACLADESWVTIDKTRLANPLGHLPDDLFAHAGERLGHLVPAREHRGLASLKDASHDDVPSTLRAASHCGPRAC